MVSAWIATKPVVGHYWAQTKRWLKLQEAVQMGASLGCYSCVDVAFVAFFWVLI